MFTDQALNYLVSFFLGGGLVALFCWARIAEMNLKAVAATVREARARHDYESLHLRVKALEAENHQLKQAQSVRTGAPVKPKWPHLN